MQWWHVFGLGSHCYSANYIHSWVQLWCKFTVRFVCIKCDSNVNLMQIEVYRAKFALDQIKLTHDPFSSHIRIDVNGLQPKVLVTSPKGAEGSLTIGRLLPVR